MKKINPFFANFASSAVNWSVWRSRIREFLRPPRRLRVLRAGGFLIGGTFALGLATLNTGNNLLYLLMGALLGTIALSGWLSEQALRELTVTRQPSHAVTAGDVARLTYDVVNRKRRLPSHGLEIREIVAVTTSPIAFTPAYAAVLEPGTSVRMRGELLPDRRGVYALDGVVLATSFPFGLFAKERDIRLPGMLIVWPRTDRPVRIPLTAGRLGERRHTGAGVAAGAERGEFRSLREFRPGDDPRDVHWRSTARRGEPIVRVYDRDAAEEYWLVLDTYAPDVETGEAAVEVAASVVAAAARRGERFGLAAGSARVPPGAVPGRVEAALDVLAGVIMSAAAPAPAMPAAAERCVLVTARTAGAAWADVYHVSNDAVP